MARPSDSELRLLRPLWRDRRLSAREIHDRTSDGTGWSYSTTRKTLDRMVEKGTLRIETVHGIKTFVPVRGRIETLAGLIRDFSANVLDAETPLPAAMFASSRLIDDDEIAELEALLAAEPDDAAEAP